MTKKVLWHAGLVCSCVVLLIMVSSCDMLDMFTDSLGTGSVRDQSEVLKNASVSQLAGMAGNTNSANPETAKAIMDALSKKPEELKNLDKEQKKDILNLALDTTLPMSEITELAEGLLQDIDTPTGLNRTRVDELVTEIFKSTNKPAGYDETQAKDLVAAIFAKANSTTITRTQADESVNAIFNSNPSDITGITKVQADDLVTRIFDTATKKDATDLVTQIFDSVNDFDTTALNTILADPKTLAEVDTSALANATIASIAQVAKKVGVEVLMGGVVDGKEITPPDVNFAEDSPKTIVDELLESAESADVKISDEDRAALTAAVTVAKLLTNGEVYEYEEDGITIAKDKDGKEKIIKRSEEDIKNAKLLGIVSLSDILGAFGTSKENSEEEKK